MKEKYDLAVIGGGPGGYVAAIRAAQLKKKVVLVERENLGGTCINWGCIPTKYLLTQIKTYKQALASHFIDTSEGQIAFDLKRIQNGKKIIIEKLVQGIKSLLLKNGADIVKGMAELKDSKEVQIHGREKRKRLFSEKIILATGSKPAVLPFLAANGKEVVTSQEALEWEEIPKSLLIVGGGAIGLEIGTIFQSLGCEVIVLEIFPSILPESDKEMTRRLERLLIKQGLKILTAMKIEQAAIKNNQVSLKGTCLRNNTPFEYSADKVLLAAGRIPSLEGLQSVTSGLKFSKSGFVQVNKNLETHISGVYAIGDLIGGKLLAHKASHEGIIAAENSCGAEEILCDDKVIPSAVFTQPEFSSVGLTEEQAQETYGTIKVGKVSLQGNGRAQTLEEPTGLVKVIADKEERIIGAHILAPCASELIGEMTLAVKKGLRLKDIGSSVHIHPTLSESVMEAALHARNEAIHALNL